MDTLDREGWPARKIAGFWRRIGAFVVDGFVLGIVGMILGLLFFDAFASIGAYAKLIGFAIALAYFGIGNSRIGGGQTLGKRYQGVRVVDGHDQLPTLPRSLLRYAVLGIPFFANGLRINTQSAMSTPLGYFLSLLVLSSEII